jgi:hypothetical protein
LELGARLFVCKFRFGSFDFEISYFVHNVFFVTTDSAVTHCDRSEIEQGNVSAMRKMICAGAVAFAVLGFVPVAIAPVGASELAAAQPRVDIARIKSVLKLTPEQQPLWPPVEAALRGLAREQDQSEGIIRRISHRVVAVMLDGAAIARIGAVARPLVRVLDDRQKQDAISLCYEMGLGPVLAALN